LFPLKDNIPTDRVPILTILLIVANVFVYFALQGGGITYGPRERPVIEYGAIPYEVAHPGKECGTSVAIDGQRVSTEGQLVCEGQTERLSDGRQIEIDGTPSGPSTLLTLLTSMFMHGSILHLAGNMLFLWIFGGNVEDAMSRWRFALFYALGGLAALGLQTAIDVNAAVPTIGASGAIAAVLGGYILLYPRARVVTVVFIVFFFTLIELPAFVMLGVWFLEQALVGASSLAQPAGGEGGGVAYFAHIGGFLFGLLAVRAFAQRHKRQPPRSATPAWS
jgi:membrane associated rhomboid family serine protease